MGSGREPLAPLRSAAATRLALAAAALDLALPDRGAPRLAACGCPVCLHPDNRVTLETTPRDRVSLTALRDYLQSVEASALSDAEADHFVPLIFRALAAGLEPHPLGGHLAFSRIGGTDRPARWPEDARRAVSEAFAALTVAVLLRVWLDAPQFAEQPSQFHSLDIGALAAAADHTGADLPHLLAAAESVPDLVLARALISWISHVEQGDGGLWRLDPRRSADTPLSAALYAWVGAPAFRARLEQAFFAAERDGDEAAARDLSAAHWLLVCQFGAPDASDAGPAP